MRIKLDENMPSDLTLLLRKENFDVHTVYDERLAGSGDESVPVFRDSIPKPILGAAGVDNCSLHNVKLDLFRDGIPKHRKHRNNMYRFLIVIEKADHNYSTYSPDLPGCVATGATREDVERNMYEAIELHIQGLMEDNLLVPESNSFAEYIAVAT